VRLIPGSRIPFAHFDEPVDLTIWWQRSIWNLSVGHDLPSRYRQTLKDAGLSVMPLRPDFLVVTKNHQRILLVEVKQSEGEGGGPERRGIVEAMAYLHDARALFDNLPSPRGLVVGWDAPATPRRSEVIVSNESGVLDALRVVLTSWGLTAEGTAHTVEAAS
jgi:hypothetical protein